MCDIQVLDEQTIDQIAAGEVVERPSSVVKELVENAIDAGATAITIEIKDGGISLIRITDNGQGIQKAQVPAAFLRHATSKLRTMEDLLSIASLGFRGEALSSIAAVAQVEVITKTPSELTGTKYVIEGSKEKSLEDVGAPDGTTFLVKNLFYNTPARQKFLKSPQTEASYVSNLVERLALSHPDISFQFISNNQPKLHTNGNTQLKDIIYHIFGRDITAGVMPVHKETEILTVDGYIGKPFLARGNRNYEIYFINGRYSKSRLLTKSIEDAYKSYVMKHQYPFVVLQMKIDPARMDVNVHPSKMEIRFHQEETVYKLLTAVIRGALAQTDIIPQVPPKEDKTQTSDRKKNERAQIPRGPEPFEKKRLEAVAAAVRKDSPYERKYKDTGGFQQEKQNREERGQTDPAQPAHGSCMDAKQPVYSQTEFEQLTLAESGAYHADFIKEAKRRNYTVIGQLFDTYWLVQAEQELFMIDQHAAHEKVLYENMMARLESQAFSSQQVSPPVIITMTMQEEHCFHKYEAQFTRIGFEVNSFGGREYAICAVPANLYGLKQKELFLEMLDALSQEAGRAAPDRILEKIASMSCKAAVKGSQRLSRAEALQLIEDLLELENPYNCPHGRPTIIAMSKAEIERKFKRIV
ncbi:MAG: DNA mismatch repair endonuclease MutL [Eubacterium sp.]|nr:DNA mismatch repair endonuclease MutL [Eubacterium sp.]